MHATVVLWMSLFPSADAPDFTIRFSEKRILARGFDPKSERFCVETADKGDASNREFVDLRQRRVVSPSPSRFSLEKGDFSRSGGFDSNGRWVDWGRRDEKSTDILFERVDVAERRAEVVRTFREGETGRGEAQIDPTRRRFAALDRDRVRIWNFDGGTPPIVVKLDRVLNGYTFSEHRAAFSRDGSKLFIGGAFPDARGADEEGPPGLLILDAATGKVLRNIQSLTPASTGVACLICERDDGSLEVGVSDLFGPWVQGDRLKSVMLNPNTGEVGRLPKALEKIDESPDSYIAALTRNRAVVDLPTGKAKDDRKTLLINAEGKSLASISGNPAASDVWYERNEPVVFIESNVFIATLAEEADRKVARFVIANAATGEIRWQRTVRAAYDKSGGARWFVAKRGDWIAFHDDPKDDSVSFFRVDRLLKR